MAVPIPVGLHPRWFPGADAGVLDEAGTKWGSHGWVGGDPDWESTYRKVFRTADFMRYCGGDTYHRDWGWWDKGGDWNGPDFRSSGEYLRKYGMGQLIYAFISPSMGTRWPRSTPVAREPQHPRPVHA